MKETLSTNKKPKFEGLHDYTNKLRSLGVLFRLGKSSDEVFKDLQKKDFILPSIKEYINYIKESNQPTLLSQIKNDLKKFSGSNRRIRRSYR